jgi:hypothetical protein
MRLLFFFDACTAQLESVYRRPLRPVRKPGRKGLTLTLRHSFDWSHESIIPGLSRLFFVV